MRANDWEADNRAATSQSLTDESNPGGYDAVNVYGDENASGQDYSGAEQSRIWPGLEIFNRKGYAEKDLVNYDTENYKGNLGPVSYTHLRAHETPEHLVCRLLLEKK